MFKVFVLAKTKSLEKNSFSMILRIVMILFIVSYEIKSIILHLLIMVKF